MNPRDLPIFEIEDQLVAAMARPGSRIIIEAPTGSGKSTQVPQILLDKNCAAGKQIVILQPRRIAARLLARRVAQERNVELGGVIGYQIRLDNITSAATRIKFVTEGILLRQILEDPALPGIGVLIFDEFHERHLYSDITLGRALQIQQTTRPDLQVIVMSATLETESLQKYLDPCAIIKAAGRTFPVTVEYLKKPTDANPWDLAADEFARMVNRGDEGDFLVFMPGAYEINRTIEAIRNSSESHDFIIMPLHGELTAAAQDEAVGPCAKRKVIVATNIAETSLTIDGIRAVIDSGLARIPRYDPYRGINTLLVEKISRASADQRSGRAGRTAPGHCLRLWTEAEHRQRLPYETPEIKRLELSEVVLALKASEVGDLRSFPWLERPDEQSLTRAETLLHDLGGLDAQNDITPLGRRMLAFPMHPRYARMLLAAHDLGCVRPAALLAALTQGRSLLQRGDNKKMREDREVLLMGEKHSDFFVLMRAWRWADQKNYNLNACRRLGIHAATAREVGRLFSQFLDIAKQEGLDVSEKRASEESIRRCILLGFSDQIAHRLDEGTLRCALIHKRKGVLARESVAHDSPLLVAGEVREVERRGDELEVILSLATAIEESWLRELYPGEFSSGVQTYFDSTLRRVQSVETVVFRDLVLKSKIIDRPNLDEAARLLAAEVIAGHCPIKEWDDSVEQWCLRVNALRGWQPELELPDINAEAKKNLLEQICHGAVSYKEIKDRSVWPVIKDWLSPAQQAALDQLAPEKLALPNGRKGRITYFADRPPTLAARIQDLYGIDQPLKIGAGKIALVVQVLAPNGRPVQITQDLADFWRDSYPKIKQELARKYPKHEWR